MDLTYSRPKRAFSECTNHTSVTIPNFVTSIGEASL